MITIFKLAGDTKLYLKIKLFIYRPHATMKTIALLK